jgi:hypothetical protein
MSLLKRLLAGLLLLKPGVNPRTVHVKFVVNKVAAEEVYLSNVVFPCHYHSTNTPYSSWGNEDYPNSSNGGFPGTPTSSCGN